MACVFVNVVGERVLVSDDSALQIVELLVEHQSTPPLDKAQSHMEPLADMLQAMSAKGITPIDYALQAGHRAVAQQLGHLVCGMF